MNLRELKHSVRSLTPRELRKLDAWIHELLDAVELKKHRRATSERELLKSHQVAHVTYRIERVRCGKENCKCAKGELHGPYWYAYWSEGGKTRSQYIGKRLPESPKKSAPRRVR